MPSCLLYHGPEARNSAIREANRIGKLVSDPIGDDGLKVDDARTVVGLLLSVPVGEQTGVLVVGPMDEANPKASDTLLKSIEEFSGDYVIPILWANDLGAVSLTIRSRCIEKWSGGQTVMDDDPIVSAAMSIVEAALSNDILTVASIVRSHDKREIELMSSLSEVLSNMLDNHECRAMWSRLRVVSLLRNPFTTEIFLAIMGL